MIPDTITVRVKPVTIQILPGLRGAEGSPYKGEPLEVLSGYIIDFPDYQVDQFAICKYPFHDEPYAGVHIETGMRATYFYNDFMPTVKALWDTLTKHEGEIYDGYLIKASACATLKRLEMIAWHDIHGDERMKKYGFRQPSA